MNVITFCSGRRVFAWCTRLMVLLAVFGFINESKAQTFTFTNAGATGKDGPTQTQVNAAYSTTNLNGKVTVNSGIQQWVVPQTGTYYIQAKGAQGGGAGGGLGASVEGEFLLTKGDTIQIIVGQQGESFSSDRNMGGGGGSFVVRKSNSSILLIGGGGGGSKGSYATAHATTSQTAIDGYVATNTAQGAGGSSGAGGGGAGCRGGGGGGWSTDGAVGGCGGDAGNGGLSFLNGGLGGEANSTGAEGGFGGGGSSEGTNNAWTYAGGGGGYSGGGGASNGDGTARAGGGASYNAGTNQINIAATQSGHGIVTIEALSSGAPNDAGVVAIDSPNVYCPGIHNVVATVQNFGITIIDSVTINWSVDGVSQTPFKFIGTLDTAGGKGSTTALITLGSYTFTSAAHNVVVWTSSPNGATDTVTQNDTFSTIKKSSLPPPTGLSAGTVNPTDATISWVGGSATNSWLYLNLPSGTSPSGVGTSVSVDNVKLTSLNPRTSYDFYVREVCPGGDTSSWAGPVTYRTPCLGPLSGTYTLDAGQPTSSTNFMSFSDVAIALSECGVSGAVTFNVAAGSYNEQVTIKEIPGASSTNTVTFDGQDSSKVILHHNGSGATYATVHLDGADYVTLKRMTIQTTPSTDGWCVYLSNKAEHNTIANCYLKMSTSATADVMGVVASNSGTSETSEGNNANYTLIMNNLIEGGENGIHLEGQNHGNTIIGNLITRSYNSGIEVDEQDTLTILNNRIDNMRASGGDGIYLIDVNKMFTIAGNYVIGNTYGLYISDGNDETSGARAKIYNNIIVSTGDVGFYNSDLVETDVWNNTFFADADDDAMYMTSADDIDLRNNIFYYAGTDNVYAAYITGSSFTALDYNVYYSTGPDFVYHSTAYANLAALQLGEPTYNQNSKQLDPGFVDKANYNLHLNNSGSKPYGVDLGIFTDVDGDTRCEFAPTIGADESLLGKSGLATAKVYAPDSVFVNSPALFEGYFAQGSLQRNRWYIDDVLVKDSIDFVALFTTTGQHEVKVVSRSCANTDVDSVIITVYDATTAPVADFIMETTVAQGDVLRFRDLSTGGPTSWKWEISPDIYYDANNQQQPRYVYVSGDDQSFDPAVRFDQTGRYRVCLTVTNAFGTDQVCRTNYITVVPRLNMGDVTIVKESTGYIYDDGGPDGNYSNSQLKGLLIQPCADDVFLVFSKFNLDCGDDFVRVYDGADNTAPALHTCTANIGKGGGPGLTGPGCSDECVPGLSDTFVATSGMMYIEFYSSSSNDAPGFEAKWWSTPANVPAPVADVEVPDSVCTGTIVTFFNKSQGDHVRVQWELDGDDKLFESDDTISAEWAYVIPGTATVKLIAENCGGSDTIIKTFTVYTPDKPAIRFTADNLNPTTTDEVTLSSNIRGCVDKYKWTITKVHGSGLYTQLGGTTDQMPVTKVMFHDTGCWNVELWAENVTGDSALLKTCYINVKEPYCIPTVGTVVSDVGISKVKFNTIDNTSSQGINAYSNNTATDKTTVEIGVTYDLEVSRTTNVNNISWAAWIDWNQDGDFNDINEKVGSESNSTAKVWTNPITIPVLAKEGATVMRIGVSRGTGANTPCGQNSYGEFEDYRLYISIDRTPPVITLIGSADTLVEQGRTYVDPGYTAEDNLTGDVTSKVTSTIHILSSGQQVTNLNTFVIRDYEIRYSVLDDAGNEGTATRIVRIFPDTTAPALTIAPGVQLSVDVAAGIYTTPAVFKAEDNIDGDFTGSVQQVTAFDNTLIDVVQVIDNVDPAVVGNYTVTYYAIDATGNEATVTREVTIFDDVLPTLTLLGDNPVTHQIGEPYNDAGVDPDDNYFSDADLAQLITFSTDLNINKFGTYSYTYTLIDPAGNGTVSVTRTINVTDTIEPAIQLIGAATMQADVNEPFIDLGVKVSDNHGIKGTWTAGGSFYDNFPDGTPIYVGTYTITYSVEDLAGNVVTVDRTVNVVDRVAPSVQLVGASTVNFCRFSDYQDSGYVATDNYDDEAELDVATTGSWYTDYLVTGLSGTYSITYTVTDSSGNSASATRTIAVLETTDFRCKGNGIEDKQLENSITLYPNPNSGMFTVKASLPEMKQVRMSILNVMGQEVAVVTEGMLHSGVYSVDLSNQASGVYFLQVVTGKQSFTRQVIIAR